MQEVITVSKEHSNRVSFLNADCVTYENLALTISRCHAEREEYTFTSPKLQITGGYVFIDFTAADLETMDGVYDWKLTDENNFVVSCGKLKVR